MQKLTLYALFVLFPFLQSCLYVTEENISEIKSGSFKVDVRSREFNNSGVKNVDICVAETSNSSFPSGQYQCFFRGFDISGLAVQWKSSSEIEVSMECGRVMSFSNY